MKKPMVVLALALPLSIAGGGSASAAEAASQSAASCTSAFTSATVANVVVNGPVRTGGGNIVTVGPFTPSTFVNGAVGPTVILVGCL